MGCAGSQAVQLGRKKKKATLARNAKCLGSSFLEESAALYGASMLTYVWLSQEIQESGQLRNAPLNLHSLCFFITLLRHN